MKKQKPVLHKLSLRKAAIVPLNDAVQQQVKGGLTGVHCLITRASQCNVCIPATEYLSCRCN